MKKRLLIISTIFLLIFGVSLPVHATPRIDAKAAIMVDSSTGQIIYEKNANQQLPVASISKLLTVAVVHDELQQHVITDYSKVEVTPDIATISNDPSYSSIGLVSGQSYSVIELLNAAMVKSADGATVALATAAGNSLDKFVIKMDQKAHEIGLKKAKIINPTGLTNGEMKGLASDNVPANAENEMSAKDVALLSRYLIQSYPAILQVTAQKKANFFITKDNTKSVDNLNKMLPGEQYTVSGVKINGLKTGTSDKAGACFVSTGNYKGHQIITVVLHAKGDNKDNRFVQTQNLYKMLKQDYHLQQIKLPSNVTNAKVKHGVTSNLSTSPKKLSIWSNSPLTSYTVSQNFDNKLTNNTQTLQAPIKRGQRIGSLRLTSSKLKTVSGEPLTYPLYSNESVPKGNFLERLFR
ncbi:D-alanyl-D-alanine carboxypeptidase family protein [Limosilactobacillus reuteri]|uniref:D-alanyl-D-alanine carboxypeptidase family protein n=1 Tax=Bacilli TaxID=91061 RepID=UPI003F20629D